MESSKKGLDRIKNCVDKLNHFLNNSSIESLTDEEKSFNIFNNIEKYKKDFENEMENDFNTANAITCIFEIVRAINSAISDKSSKEFLQKLLKELLDICNVLGILYDVEYKDKNIDEKEIEELISKRQEAKSNKDYKLADEIRDMLSQKGIILKDTSAGVVWSVK